MARHYSTLHMSCHLRRVAGNTVWSYMACEFPQRYGRLDCELLYPYTLLLLFYFLALIDQSIMNWWQLLCQGPTDLIIFRVWQATISSHLLLLSQLLHPFNSFFSRTTWVRQYPKGKTSLDLNEAKDDGDGSGISWTICKQSASWSRQITTLTPSSLIGQTLFLTPNQQCQSQSTEGTQSSTFTVHNMPEGLNNLHLCRTVFDCDW